MNQVVAIKDLPRTGADGDRAESVRRIVYERALVLFEKKGFRATSMNEIAEACGISKPAIYHYYRNKSHLLETLYEDITADFYGMMEALAHSPGGAAARLRRVVEMQALYNIENRRFLTIFWRERHEFDAVSRKALAAREREFEDWFRHILEEGQAGGEFRRQDSQIVVLAILGLLSTVQRWALHAGKEPHKIAEELGRLVLDGVSAAGPRNDDDQVNSAPAAARSSRRRARSVPVTEAIRKEVIGGNDNAGGKARPRNRRR